MQKKKEKNRRKVTLMQKALASLEIKEKGEHMKGRLETVLKMKVRKHRWSPRK